AASAAVNGGTPYSVAVSNASGGTFNAANYTITYSDGSLTITPKALAVTALDAAKTHDGVAWSGGNGIRLDGLVNGETQDALSGALAYGGNSQGAIDAGRYKITPYGLFSDNYVINFLDGLLNILPAPQPQLPAPNPTIPSGGNLWATSGLYAQDPTEIPPEIRLALDQNGAPGRGGIPYLAIEDDSVALGIRHSGEASGE
ncbi:MBG domain-containing protein, partial [Castellaniella sp. S9]|uniref:MBG domain-containing protein n=1 Tax=Castellaniella sp. S9 TaxID=2993652 RepID=UPI0022B5BD5A